jgi:hypothetical protein
LVGKPEGKRPLRRPRYCWEFNIKMNQGWRVWIGLIWLRIRTNGRPDLVNRIMNLHVLLKAGNFLTS